MCKESTKNYLSNWIEPNLQPIDGVRADLHVISTLTESATVHWNDSTW